LAKGYGEDASTTYHCTVKETVVTFKLTEISSSKQIEFQGSMRGVASSKSRFTKKKRRAEAREILKSRVVKVAENIELFYNKCTK